MAKKKDESIVEESTQEVVEPAAEETAEITTEPVNQEGVDNPTVSEETTDETVEEAPTEEVEEKKTKKSEPKTPARQFAHGAKHRESVAKVDKNKTYPIAEAIELVKQTTYTKFDGSIDVHVRLTESKKTEDAVRGTVTLPHGTGRERKVVLITEDMIEKIEKGWLDFDVAVATPDMMPKLAKLAKILGPKGLMPNPKSGTVTAEPEKAMEELKGGRVEFKADSLGNIHQAIGKVSWDAAKLTENFQTFVAALPKSRIRSVSIAPTMGAGVKIAL